MTEVAVLWTAQLDGTPRDRGRAHGEVLRAVIAAVMQRWRDGLRQTTGLDPDDYLDRFVNGTDFLPAIKRWAPALLDEVHGIGEGADVPFRDIYAYQLMDEEWLFRFSLTRAAGGAPATAGGRRDQALDRCSTLGVLGEEGSPTLLAQNMDLPKVYDGTQTLLRVRLDDGDLDAFVFTPAGLIGTTGLNSRGVGICTNALGQLGHAAHGLPVAFIVRRVLEHATLEEAAEFVCAVPHASGQNYLIGGPRGLVDLECSATAVVPCMAGATRLYHTNHPLANDDQPWRDEDATGAAFGARPTGSEPSPGATPVFGAGPNGTAAGSETRVHSNSEQRLAFLARTMEDEARPVTVEMARGLLSSCEVPVSVPRDSRHGGMTLGSLVMQLAAAPLLDLAPGPPAQTAYRRWTFA
jgi:hypothetical protein